MQTLFYVYEVVYSGLAVGALWFLLWVANFVFMPSILNQLHKLPETLKSRKAKHSRPSKAELLIHDLLVEVREVRDGLRLPVSING